MAKPILYKYSSASKEFNHCIFPCTNLERHIYNLSDDLAYVMTHISYYPQIKKSSIFKKLVKLSQDFVKIASTQEGV